MRRMVGKPLGIAALAAILFFASKPAKSLDVTIPNNIIQWEAEAVEPVEGAYYYTAASTKSSQNGLRSYLYVFDSHGELVYFRQPRPGEERVDVHLPYDSHQRASFSIGDVDESLGVFIQDSTCTTVDTIPHQNPYNPHYILDAHDVLMLDDGSLYTTWRDTQDVDMSSYIPGGDPNARVVSHVIEHWDADHNLLWSWNGHDHIDELPYTARIDSNGLYHAEVEHLHVNSIGLFPNGDLLVSSRMLSVLFRLDRETGDVLWRFGGGPLNDFAISDSTDLEIPVDFNLQHDGRVLPNGHITLFDNGYYHTPRESYAREYALDEANHTAALVWAKYQGPRYTYSGIHGSVRQYDDGHTLIGWGSITPEIHCQEVDENGDVVFQLSFQRDFHNMFQVPRAYRFIRSDRRPIAAKPYLCERLIAGEIQLFANWWGHENEVASYDVYWGQTDPPPYHGNTATGVYVITGDFFEETWYGRIRALDYDGNEISPLSEPLIINPGLTSVGLAANKPYPQQFTLSPNWPNPFNASTTVTVSVTRPGPVRITVHDLLGRTVRTVHEGMLQPGSYPFAIDMTALPSGVFFLRAMDGSGQSQVRQITMVK